MAEKEKQRMEYERQLYEQEKQKYIEADNRYIEDQYGPGRARPPTTGQYAKLDNSGKFTLFVIHKSVFWEFAADFGCCCGHAMEVQYYPL